MKYAPIPILTVKEIEEQLKTADVGRLPSLLLSTSRVENPAWAQTIFLRYMDHDDEDTRDTATYMLGAQFSIGEVVNYDRVVDLIRERISKGSIVVKGTLDETIGNIRTRQIEHKYMPVPELGRLEIVAKLSLCAPLELGSLLFAVAESEDRIWAQNTLIGYLEHEDLDISRAAAVCLNRLYYNIDELEEGLSLDEELIKARLEKARADRPVLRDVIDRVLFAYSLE